MTVESKCVMVDLQCIAHFIADCNCDTLDSPSKIRREALE